MMKSTPIKEVHARAYEHLQEPPVVEVVQMIRVTHTVGDGIDDPLRPVDCYYTMDGKLVAGRGDK
ncbi:MAG TPA: hypothetical protein DIW20_03625 [Rhodospirillaceae bacterium]|nr:hypothetical protein [Rhodospirillaceae bacterium]